MSAYMLVTLRGGSTLEQKMKHWLMLMGTMGSVPQGSAPREVVTYMRRSGDALYLLIHKSGSRANMRWLDFAGGWVSGYQACPGYLLDIIKNAGGSILDVTEYGAPPDKWQNAK